MDPSVVVAIGASEGGAQAIRQLVAALPADFPAPVLVVLHIGRHDTNLPEVLDRSGPLKAAFARTDETLRAGRVYVAPPDRHMILSDGGAVRLTKGPRENFARPAVDPLFRTAAELYGAGAIGVVLTGGLTDGSAGLFEIKSRGGASIVQDPAEAANPGMPKSALAHVAVDHCVLLAAMPEVLIRTVEERLAASARAPSTPAKGLEEDEMSAEYTLEQPAAVTCPDCGGAMRLGRVGSMMQFRCHIGHVYTGDAAASGQLIALERSLEAALRSLNERAEICREMARADGEEKGETDAWRGAMQEALDRATTLRALLESDWAPPGGRRAEA